MLLLFQLPEKWETHKEKRERRALDLGRETKSHSMEESYCEKYVYCSQIFNDEDYMLAPLFCSGIFLPFYGQPRTRCCTVLKLHGSRLQVGTELSECLLFAPPDARTIFLHNDILCNDTCSVTGVSITYWGGGHKRKRSSGYLS